MELALALPHETAQETAMPVAPQRQDRRLCLDELLPALTAHGLIDTALAESLRRTPANGLHPWSFSPASHCPIPRGLACRYHWNG